MKFRKKMGRAIARFFLWLFLVILATALLVGGVTLFFYQRVGEQNLPDAKVLVNETPLDINGYQWSIPILGGLTQKQLAKAEDLTVQDLGTFDTQPILQLPDTLRKDCTTQVTVTDQQGQTVFSGSAEELQAFSFVKNGQYQTSLRIYWPPFNGKPTGEYFYQFRFQLDLKSEISISATSVSQGDVIAVAVTGLPQGAQMQVETELGRAYPVERFDKMMAYIPVAYNREDKKYPVKVTAGGYTQEFEVEVLYNPFKKVNLPADTLSGSDAAIQKYQQTVRPLYETWADTVMWSGVFQSPVEQPNDGVVLSDYGNFEYIADRTKPARNTGITFKCHADKPVIAPAGGTVAFAGELELTKGLVVIEHGAGVKSYLYHLGSVEVKTGDTVQAGTVVGKTTELLQFDLRIGNQAVNPNLAMNGKNGLFWR